MLGRDPWTRACALRFGGLGVHDGVRVNDPLTTLWFVDCDIDANGSDGIGQGSPARAKIYLRDCSIHNNTHHGVVGGNLMSLMNCLVYNNTGSGIKHEGENGHLFIEHCTVDSNQADGVTLTAPDELRVFECRNNIFSNNGDVGLPPVGYGVNFAGAFPEGRRGPNCYFRNGKGAVSVDGMDPALGGITDVDVDGTAVTADPQYVSAPSNFALQSTSPCIDAGLPGVMPVGGTGYNSMGALIPD